MASTLQAKVVRQMQGQGMDEQGGSLEYRLSLESISQSRPPYTTPCLLPLAQCPTQLQAEALSGLGQPALLNAQQALSRLLLGAAQGN